MLVDIKYYYAFSDMYDALNSNVEFVNGEDGFPDYLEDNDGDLLEYGDDGFEELFCDKLREAGLLVIGDNEGGYWAEESAPEYLTMDGAMESLERNKDATQYFSGEVKATDIAIMLRQMGFGVAETNTIIAALVLVGAKFRVG